MLIQKNVSDACILLTCCFFIFFTALGYYLCCYIISPREYHHLNGKSIGTDIINCKPFLNEKMWFKLTQARCAAFFVIKLVLFNCLDSYIFLAFKYSGFFVFLMKMNPGKHLGDMNLFVVLFSLF